MASTLTPQPKVVAGGLAGAVTVIIVYVAQQGGLTITPEVASAVTTVISFVAGYLTSNK